jgi:hypothetical protein
MSSSHVPFFGAWREQFFREEQQVDRSPSQNRDEVSTADTTQ